MDAAKLAQIIQEVVGTRTYLPITESERILVFERKGYIHIFCGLQSIFGARQPIDVANRLIELVTESEAAFHQIIQDKVNGL